MYWQEPSPPRCCPDSSAHPDFGPTSEFDDEYHGPCVRDRFDIDGSSYRGTDGPQVVMVDTTTSITFCGNPLPSHRARAVSSRRESGALHTCKYTA